MLAEILWAEDDSMLENRKAERGMAGHFAEERSIVMTRICRSAGALSVLGFVCLGISSVIAASQGPFSVLSNEECSVLWGGSGVSSCQAYCDTTSYCNDNGVNCHTWDLDSSTCVHRAHIVNQNSYVAWYCHDNASSGPCEAVNNRVCRIDYECLYSTHAGCYQAGSGTSRSNEIGCNDQSGAHGITSGTGA